MEFFLFKIYMYKWKCLIHYIKPLGALRWMLIIKQSDFENIGYYNLQLQIINIVIGYGNSNISLTPICGMLNWYVNILDSFHV